MRVPFSLILAAAVAGIAAPAASLDRRTPEEKVAQATAGRVPGKPVSCISRRFAEISPAGDRLIVRSGRTVYINEAEGGCPMRADRILVTRSSSSQMCRGDYGQLVERLSGAYAGNCILGDFVPYTAAK